MQLCGNDFIYSSAVFIAALMATEAVNRNNSILKDYHLELYAYDGQCRADMVMKSFIDYIRLPTFPNMVGILGKPLSLVYPSLPNSALIDFSY